MTPGSPVTWVASQAERERLEARPALGAGRVLEVDGRPLLVTRLDADAAARSRHGRPRRAATRRAGVGRDGRTTAELLERWLRARARRAIALRVAARSAEMAVHPGRISIRDQSSRWASASPSGALSFNWRLILAPPAVLDAVVVHELAHLRIRGHSRSLLGARGAARAADDGRAPLAACPWPRGARPRWSSRVGPSAASQDGEGGQLVGEGPGVRLDVRHGRCGRELVRKSSTASSTSPRR